MLANPRCHRCNTASALRTLDAPVAVLTQAGQDVHGAELLRQFAAAGVDTAMVMQDEGVSTSLAVLPVFEAGGRGCWVDLSANDLLSPAVRSAPCRPPHHLQRLRG